MSHLTWPSLAQRGSSLFPTTGRPPKTFGSKVEYSAPSCLGEFYLAVIGHRKSRIAPLEGLAGGTLVTHLSKLPLGP